MRTIEVYIVKKDDIQSYEVKNTKGIGWCKLEKPIPISEENNKTISAEIEKDYTEEDVNNIENTEIEEVEDPAEKNPKEEFIVKLNGEELKNMQDYYTTDSKIIFNNPLSKGDKIEIYDSILNSVKVVTKNSYNKNALFTVFDSYMHFKYNHTYQFSLPIKDQIFSTEFSTKYDPFYTTIKKIRMDTGDLLNLVPDGQIAALIYQYSKEVQETLGDDTDEIPVYASNVVRYKTDIDLCWAIYLSISGKYGVKNKKIGSIEIEKNTKVPYIDTMVKRFRELLAENEELLNKEDTILSFVKAKSTEYTVPNRGVF